MNIENVVAWCAVSAYSISHIKNQIRHTFKRLCPAVISQTGHEEVRCESCAIPVAVLEEQCFCPCMDTVVTAGIMPVGRRSGCDEA